MKSQAWVYIMASRMRGTLYIGVTSDLKKRVWQHKNDVHDGFSAQHGVHRLVYFEESNSIETAITREKQLKNWRRDWKIELIEADNPNWCDLYERDV